jgi:predicted acylesterase/phospholipase RssA
MIGWDIGMLSLLKTFALMRSYIRYYTIKSGFSKKKNDPNHKYNKRGRRREWRGKINGASDYNEFLHIEIQEPVPVDGPDSDSAGIGNTRGGKSAAAAAAASNAASIPTLINMSPSSKDKMIRAKSCLQLHHQIISIPQASIPTRRIPSILDLQQLQKERQGVEEKEAYLEKELGNLGFMIVNTTNRLRETRELATRARDTRLKNRNSIENGTGNGIGNSISNSSGMKKICSENELESETDTEADLRVDKNNHRRDPNTSESSTASDDYDTSASALKFLLAGVVKRNHLSVNDLLIQDAASVMECGMHTLSAKARDVVLGYHEEVETCLEWIAESKPVGYTSKGANVKLESSVMEDLNNDANLSARSTSPSPAKSVDFHSADVELADRLNLVRKLKQNMGRTALMLSGGGAQAMYHLGTIKALCESNMYDDIQVISGTSGGSITAAMCALKTKEELLKDVCVPHVSTDFGLTGQQQRENIRWFPKVIDMGTYWLKHKLLVDSKEFNRCCEFYFKDFTFEEAFKKTGKQVCITVSASRAETGGAQRLLLNHISTPHVTLASAVAASCALPGVMAPAKLRTKNSEGQQELFEVDGVEWIDGSVQADLPFKRISTLFNVSSYIVCQTNFHVLPFLHKAHHPNMKSLYWKIFQTCEWDIRSRALNLSRLGLFPKIFGQDISKVFKQKYHGDLTLVPRFTTLQVFGLKSLVNPDEEDMNVYLQNGQSAAWPYLGVIKEMLRLERAIDKCMNKLNEQRRQLAPDEDDDWDDIGSITSAGQSNRSRALGSRRATELLKNKVLRLELENAELRNQLERSAKKPMITASKRGKPNEIDEVDENEKKPASFWKKLK